MTPAETEKKALQRRFNIIKGQLDGIMRMIDADADCVAIITQMKAVKVGFNRLGESFIKNYLKQCVQKKQKSVEGKEFNQVLKLLSDY